MKLTCAVFYALQALVDLAGRKSGHPVPSHLVAETSGVPPMFLLKVFKSLAAARILRSLKGPSGGYSLARPVKDITLLEVVEAIEGPVRGQIPFTAANGKKGKGLEGRLQGIYDQLADQTRKQLQKVHVSDLAGKGR